MSDFQFSYDTAHDPLEVIENPFKYDPLEVIENTFKPEPEHGLAILWSTRYYHGDHLNTAMIGTGTYASSDMYAALQDMCESGDLPAIVGFDPATWQRSLGSGFTSFRMRQPIPCPNPECPDAWHLDILVIFVPTFPNLSDVN